MQLRNAQPVTVTVAVPINTGWSEQNSVNVPGLSNVRAKDSPMPRNPESQPPSGVPGNVPPVPEVLVCAMLPSFVQRTVSPTEMDTASGLKNPTHGLGFPSHPSTPPTETKCLVAAGLVLVVVVVELVVEPAVVAVVETGAVEVVAPDEVVVVGVLVEVVEADAANVEVACEGGVVPGVDEVVAAPVGVVVESRAEDVAVLSRGLADWSDAPKPHEAATRASATRNASLLRETELAIHESFVMPVNDLYGG